MRDRLREVLHYGNAGVAFFVFLGALIWIFWWLLPSRVLVICVVSPAPPHTLFYYYSILALPYCLLSSNQHLDPRCHSFCHISRACHTRTRPRLSNADVQAPIVCDRLLSTRYLECCGWLLKMWPRAKRHHRSVIVQD